MNNLDFYNLGIKHHINSAKLLADVDSEAPSAQVTVTVNVKLYETTWINTDKK